jgi:hypothetical protein
MQDVQKELFLLREKVHILDTDETRALKMKQLEDDQNRLKTESVLLDEQNDVMRQKLRALTISMQSVERDRDWLLERLQKAKKKYTKLEKTYASEKARLTDFEDGDIVGSSVSISQESSLFLDMYNMKKLQKSAGRTGSHALLQSVKSREGTGSRSHSNLPQINHPRQLAKLTSAENMASSDRQGWRQRLVTEIAVSRSNPLLPMASSSQGRGLGQGPHSSKLHSTAASAPTLRRVSSRSPERAAAETTLGRGKHTRGKTKLEKSAVALLVSMRARQEHIRQVVDKCFKSCDRGAALLSGKETSSAVIVPLPEIVVACMESIVANREAPDDELVADARRDFIMQLIYHPETYLAIADVIGGKYNQPQQGDEGFAEGRDDAIDDGLQTILQLNFGGDEQQPVGDAGDDAGEGEGEGEGDGAGAGDDFDTGEGYRGEEGDEGEYDEEDEGDQEDDMRQGVDPLT